MRPGIKLLSKERSCVCCMTHDEKCLLQKESAPRRKRRRVKAKLKYLLEKRQRVKTGQKYLGKRANASYEELVERLKKRRKQRLIESRVKRAAEFENWKLWKRIHQLPLDSCLSENANQGVDFENNPDDFKNVVSPQSSTSVASQVVSNSSHISSLPASENWPGLYDFTVSFNPQNKDTKGISWTFSEIKNKLYVGKDVPCPINFSVNTFMHQNDVTIRAMALYSSPEQVSERVHRCVNHSMEEINNGRIEAEHLVRCESSAASYHSDVSSGRHSVVVPFENPGVGQPYSTYIYKFACFGSCAGGPNRRPLMLIFTLEHNNQVIGRRKIDLKICACPGRDRKSDEAQCLSVVEQQQRPVKRKAQNELVNLSEIFDFTKHVYIPMPKKPKVTPNADGAYVLEVEDKGCYDFLLQMKNFYEVCKFMKNFQPETMNKAKHIYLKNEKKN